MRTEPIIFLIDDDDGFANLIETIATSVGVDTRRFDSVSEFRDQFDHRAAGCVIVDLGKPRLGAEQLLDELANAELTQPLIALTDGAPVDFVVRAAREGAVAFLQKTQVTRNEILDSIQLALKQDQEARKRFDRRKEIERRFGDLNDVERRVMELLLTGQEITATAKQLEISRRTVEKHRANLMQKLAVNSFIELVALSVEKDKFASTTRALDRQRHDDHVA